MVFSPIEAPAAKEMVWGASIFRPEVPNFKINMVKKDSKKSRVFLASKHTQRTSIHEQVLGKKPFKGLWINISLSLHHYSSWKYCVPMSSGRALEMQHVKCPSFLLHLHISKCALLLEKKHLNMTCNIGMKRGTRSKMMRKIRAHFPSIWDICSIQQRNVFRCPLCAPPPAINNDRSLLVQPA